MMNKCQPIVYKGKEVCTSLGAIKIIGVEFNVLLRMFNENKGRFKHGKDYYLVDRELFSKYIGRELKGSSKQIYIWTKSGISKFMVIMEDEAQITIFDKQKPPEISLPVDDIDMGMTSKILYDRCGLGRNTLFKLLRDKKVLTANNVPYQEYINRGYFKIKVEKKKHDESDYYKTMVTPKGVIKILEWFGGG